VNQLLNCGYHLGEKRGGVGCGEWEGGVEVGVRV